MSGSDDEDVYHKIDDREWGIAWSKYQKSNGRLENIPTASHLRKFLGKLNINLTEKSCDTLMTICKQKGQIPYVHLTTLKSVIKEALDKYKGLPVDQAIGGLIIEFNASDTGRKHRHYQSMQSMQAIVAASTKSLSHYALSKVKETPEQRQKRRMDEKRKREEKRRKLTEQKSGGKSSRSKGYGKKKMPTLTEENLRKKNKEPSPDTSGPFSHTTSSRKYSGFLQQNPTSDNDEEGSDSPSNTSVVINQTPAKSDDSTPPDFPNTSVGTSSRNSIDKISPLQLINGNSNRLRSPSSDVALQRKKKKVNTKYIDRDNRHEKKVSFNDLDITQLGSGGSGGGGGGSIESQQHIVEMFRRQETMLYRIGTQMSALDRQIKEMSNEQHNEETNELQECIIELQYLKTSSIAAINAELSNLKLELFDGFESISISSAYNVSQTIKTDLNEMNNKLNTTVRLWSNDWNIKKRVLSNQQRLDNVLFKAQKILRKYQEHQSNLNSKIILNNNDNNDSKMNSNQLANELDSIQTNLKSMDHYLNTFVFDRLSRMENALVRIFKECNNLSDPNDNTNNNNKTIKRFSVDELMNQLDSQRLMFDGQLRQKQQKITDQKEELKYMKQREKTEKLKIENENKQYENLKGKYELEQSNNKQLQFDLKAMKSQMERLSMFNNSFGSGQDYNVPIATNDNNNKQKPKNKFQRNITTVIHPDISERNQNDISEKNVDLNLEFDKFYTNSVSSLIGDFISKAKLQNKKKANEFHAKKESGHLMFRKDEMPKFLANKNNRDAQQQELEDRLGFGYQELYYLYRENTEINVRCNRLEHENKCLRDRLDEIEPVIVVENVQNVSVNVSKQLNELYEKLRNTQAQWKDIEDSKKIVAKQIKFIDKYRIESLQDAKKADQEIQSQMNYDKFQFQRQRKKMNALMKSEKEGVLKEREIMEEERQEIEELKNEWKNKLSLLEEKELEFDEKVVLARTNMNEVVFQKGLSELLKKHKEEWKYELRQEVGKDMIGDETEHIREECEQQIEELREYYNTRFDIQVNKNDKMKQECDQLKLQIKHFENQIKKLNEDVVLRDEHYEKISGSYDRLEREYQILKKEYRNLEKIKHVESSSSDMKEDDVSNGPGNRKGKKNRKGKRKLKKKGGHLAWLESDSEDDEITKLEKKSISKWLNKRYSGQNSINGRGDNSSSGGVDTNWLVLPQDIIAGKNADIESLNSTIKLLTTELDNKNKLIGNYKGQIFEYKKKLKDKSFGGTGDVLMNKLNDKHKNLISKFDEDVVTVKKWLRVWEDGIKTVTKAQDKWTMKNSELIKKEKEIQKEKEDLIYDQRMWYAHKNHILRRFYYFTKQVWWNRFMVHEFQKSRADQEMALSMGNNSVSGKKPTNHLECPLWNQYYKMMLESWFETGVYQHALTRWFCQYQTYSKEKDLFYYGDNDNNEELYIFKDNVLDKIQPHLDSIIERYYKQKWLKRRMKFGRCFISSDKPKIIIDKSFKGFKKVVRDLFNTLHEKEPIYNKINIKNVIEKAEKEMHDKIDGFSRVAWDMVKMTDGVGVVSLMIQKKQKLKDAKNRRKSTKHNVQLPPTISTVITDNDTPTPSNVINKRKKKVRIASKEVGRTSTTIKPTNMDRAMDRKRNDDEKMDEKKEDSEKRPAKRASMKTPKASSQPKTWSHAMDNFKSVNKKQKKKMTAEEKKKLRAKRKAQRSEKNKDMKNKSSQKRSSVKNPMSNLGGSFHIKPDKGNGDGSGIKMIKPDMQND